MAWTEPGATNAWQPLSPAKLRTDLHIVFSICLTLYILLCSFWGWACLALLVPTPVAGYQCGPHFCAALPSCECLPTGIRMGYSLVFSEYFLALRCSVFWAILPSLQSLWTDGVGTVRWHSLMRLCIKGWFFFFILNLPPSLNIQIIKGSKWAARVLWLKRFQSNAFFSSQWPSFALQAGPWWEKLLVVSKPKLKDETSRLSAGCILIFYCQHCTCSTSPPL